MVSQRGGNNPEGRRRGVSSSLNPDGLSNIHGETPRTKRKQRAQSLPPNTGGLVGVRWDDTTEAYPTRRKSMPSSARSKSGSVNGSRRLKPTRQRAASHRPTKRVRLGEDIDDSARRSTSSRRERPLPLERDLEANEETRTKGYPVKKFMDDSTYTTTASSRGVVTCCVAGSCVLLIFALIAVVVGLLLMDRKQKTSAEAIKETVAMPFLPQFTRSAISSDVNSPQGRAFSWLLQHPDYETMPDWRKRQLMALLTLEYSTGMSLVPDNRLNECDWPLGLDCTPDGEYQELRLFWGGLEGTIPPEISFLTALTSLSLRGSELTGPLPSVIGRLVSLRSMYLQENHLTGSIPREIGALTSLQYLSLHINDLTGTLPPELGRLTALRLLTLEDNFFTGKVPEQLGALTALTSLSIFDNALSGSIPSSLGRAANLERLLFFNNYMTGVVAPGICELPDLVTILVDCQLVSCPCAPCNCHILG